MPDHHGACRLGMLDLGMTFSYETSYMKLRQIEGFLEVFKSACLLESCILIAEYRLLLSALKQVRQLKLCKTDNIRLRSAPNQC